MTKIGLPCPYKLKFFKNVILWNQKADDLKTWNAALSIPMLPSLAAWHKLYEGLNILELLLVLALHNVCYFWPLLNDFGCCIYKLKKQTKTC